MHHGRLIFRVKRFALLSPWKRSVWSRGAPGYARWQLWVWGLRRGPFCRRQPPGVRGWSCSLFPLQVEAWRGTGRQGSIEPFGDDGSVSATWRPSMAAAPSALLPLPPLPSLSVPIASRAAVVLPPQRLDDSRGRGAMRGEKTIAAVELPETTVSAPDTFASGLDSLEPAEAISRRSGPGGGLSGGDEEETRPFNNCEPRPILPRPSRLYRLLYRGGAVDLASPTKGSAVSGPGPSACGRR